MVLVPRTPEAVFAFFESQKDLGEYPGHSNNNWITHACHFDGSPWCAMCVSLAYIAAGFNESGQILDLSNPPNWRDPVPNIAGLGFGTTYRWGSAYTWSFASDAAKAGRWSTDLDSAKPGDTVLINHNGRGQARDNNSHTCLFTGERDRSGFLTWNGNISDTVKLAYWTNSEVEGFCHPAFVSTSQQPDQEDDDMIRLFTYKGGVYLGVFGAWRKHVTTPGIVNMLERTGFKWNNTDNTKEIQQDVFDSMLDLGLFIK